MAPSSRVISTSSVGLPRESRISRAVTVSMAAMVPSNAVHCFRRRLAVQLLPHSEHLGNAPRLGDAAARAVGLGAAENLTNRTDARLTVQVLDQHLEQCARAVLVLVDAQV